MFIKFSLISILICLSSIFGMLSFKFASEGKWLHFLFDIISYSIYIFASIKEGYIGEIILSISVIIMYLFSMKEWRKNEIDKTVKINHIEVKEHLISIIISILLFIAYGIILKKINCSLPFLNSIMTISFLLGNYFSFRRSIYSFYYWSLYEIIFIIIWFISAIYNEIIYSVFLIDGLCELVFGIVSIKNWKIIQSKQEKIKYNSFYVSKKKFII